MTRRPLDPQFTAAVLEERKFTTIRDKPWPVGVPIMLYNWTGSPYRSKQKDVTVIIVRWRRPIEISHSQEGLMSYLVDMDCSVPLYQTEGFPSQEAMDTWFRRLVKPGQTIFKYLMRFRLAKAPKTPPLFPDPALKTPHPGRRCPFCGSS